MSNLSAASDHYFVAIGASAGGLEAIHEFFDHMPTSNHLSFVIIQHLSPEHKSLLVELLGKHTSMGIVEAKHDMRVDKGCIYVIPNNKLLTIEGGLLKLSDRGQAKAPNTAINTFFTSLAEDKRDKAIGVILSGTGTDGVAGAADIQKHGGTVFVQDPISAKFDGMPNSAISAGVADYILSPELIPDEIFTAINEQPKRKRGADGLDETKLPKVLERIHEHCGYDFTNYKTPTLLRRISRRMEQLGAANFDDYFRLLNENDAECEVLGKEFLINVTKFFRDRPVFDILENEVLPKVLSNREPEDPLKVWVTACSTGQEAYSIAITIDQYLSRTNRKLEVKIFACDIDKEAVDEAAKAVYPVSALDEMDAETRHRYFTIEGDKATIVPRIRKQIVFTPHNILRDPPFIKNDIVTCRNMLIYMNPILQEKVFGTLQFALKTKGYLVLGPSEVPHSIKNSLEEVDGKWKVYKKIAHTATYDPERIGAYQVRNSSAKNAAPLKESTIIRSLTDEFREILAEECGYAAVYLDKSYEIKAAIGSYRRYLSLPDSIVNFNILKMVKTDLSVVLNTAIRKAGNSGRRVSMKNVRAKLDGADRYMNLIVKPATANTYTTVILSEAGKADTASPVPEGTPVVSGQQHQHQLELEEELRETRLNLQTAIESMETANEELQSSNEELLSANEELQSSNEELQSLNEELHTLNTEHQLRIRELIELNDDLNNHFASTQIGQVFLDADLKVRKFSPSVVKVINLREGDVGRPIDHIATNMTDAGFLIDELKAVLRTGESIEKEVSLRGGGEFIMRLFPYVRKDKDRDGLVMTFVDVTANKELHNLVKGVFDSSSSVLMTVRTVRNEKEEPVDFEWTSANGAADRFLGMGNGEYMGKRLKETASHLHRSGFFERCVEVLQQEGPPVHFETALPVNGDERWFGAVLTKLMDGLVINLTDVNEKKEAEEKLKTAYFELVRARDAVKKLNTELEQKVAERTAQLTESEERFRIVAATSSDAIWDWDLAGNNIWWSESFFHLFGYTEEEAKGGSRFWLANIHPDDLPAVRESLDGIMGGSAKDWTARYRFRKADGTYAFILNKSSVLQDEHGTPYRILSSMVDVSAITQTTIELEEKNKELHALIQEFKFVTDFMPQLVWATAPDGYHDFYNKGWYDYTGLSYEQTEGEGWNAVLHPDDQERAWEVWRHSLQTGAPYEIEYRFKRHDGAYRWFLGRALPLRDESGTILKWFGTCTDIHDQKTESDLLEEKVAERTAQLQASNRELAERNDELLQFTAVTSHDLKEPLRKIQVFGNLLQEQFLDGMKPGAEELLEKIVKSSSRMSNLINDLLGYSQLDGDDQFKSVNLNDLLDDVLSDLELSIRQKNAIVEVGPLRNIECIPSQFQRIFQNLISNSLKFSRKNEVPVIRISGEDLGGPTANGNGLYRITFADNGIGFEKQYAKKIFGIFQRLHNREKFEGTGIGLAIVKKIVEKHGGTIIADGEGNPGAVFVITVPVARHSLKPAALSRAKVQST